LIEVVTLPVSDEPCLFQLFYKGFLTAHVERIGILEKGDLPVQFIPLLGTMGIVRVVNMQKI
jgi:hypothetical protein